VCVWGGGLVCKECGHAVGDKKSKSRGREGKEGKLIVQRGQGWCSDEGTNSTGPFQG
jgi:hypothetical protein